MRVAAQLSPSLMATGVVTGMLCSAASTWMFSMVGKDFFPLTLVMWPGALALGVGLGWLAGCRKPWWLVSLAGALVPFGNTIITALLVGFLQLTPIMPDTDFEVGGLLMIGATLFGPALAPYGLLSGILTWLVVWLVNRFGPSGGRDSQLHA